MFRIIGELVEGFDELAGVEPAVTIYGSARLKPEEELFARTEEIARRLGELGFSIISGGGPVLWKQQTRAPSKLEWHQSD